MISFLLVCLSSLLLSTVSAGEETIKELEIHTADDLITFSNSVNSGLNYSGTTAFLTSDIYFDESTSNLFYPIGNASANFFGGTFDGQGYTINNLKITQGSNYGFGLFGYSKGSAFKNVVLGSSCEFICQVNNIAYVSGIIGYCGSSGDTSCSVSNSVNMANVTFNATSYGPPIYMGGIAGQTQEIKNCANYGIISFSGSSSVYTSIGGIVGYSSKSVVTNCINYGELVHDGISDILYLGRIIGYFNSESTITNCVSMGQITLSGISGKCHVGSVAGNIISTTIVTNCYWNDGIGYDTSGNGEGKYINVSSFNTNTLELNESVTAGGYTGKSLISALNGFVKTNNNLSLWVSNTNEKSVSFIINNRTTPLLNTNKKLILFPDLSNENTFHGWFKDKCFNKPFNGNSISDETETFHGKYGDFTPEEGCDTSSSSSSSSSTTTTSSNRLSSSSHSLKSSISSLQTSSSSSNSLSSSSSLSLMLSSSSSMSKRYSSLSSSSSSKPPSEYIEIIFGNKDLTEEEVIEIIKDITKDDDFEIIEFKEDENGDLKVIVKFNDVEEGLRFFKNIKSESDMTKFNIMRIAFITDFLNSLSMILLPLVPVLSIFI